LNIYIVIPAKNEEKTIGNLVTAALLCGYSVIVVDDESSDATVNIARSAGAIVLCNIKNLGAWKATQAGMRFAYKKGADVVITMDADGQHDVVQIQKLIDSYQSGADVVIGNCVTRGSRGRHIAWRILKKINRLDISDITSGFRLYNRVAMHTLISRQATMLEYQCVGILIMLRNMKLNITEVSVPMSERADGISRIFYSWKAVFYYLMYSTLLSVTKAYPTKKDKFLKNITH